MSAVALALVAAATVVALAVLTALGGRRRGDAWPLAVLGGVFFPVAWAAWYVHDGERGARHGRAQGPYPGD